MLKWLECNENLIPLYSQCRSPRLLVSNKKLLKYVKGNDYGNIFMWVEPLEMHGIQQVPLREMHGIQ